MEKKENNPLNNFTNKLNSVKSLSQLEESKKQKIIYKPNSDKFFVPLFYLCLGLGIALLAIGIIINAYAFNSFSLGVNNYIDLNTSSYYVNMVQLIPSAALILTAACIFVLCLIMRLFRFFAYAYINMSVKRKNVDSYLLYKFSSLFILYIAFTTGIVYFALYAVTDIAMYNNLHHINTFYNALTKYLEPASIFGAICASFCLLYGISVMINYALNFIKSMFKNKQTDEEYIAMRLHKTETSFIKLLLNKILVWIVFICALCFVIATWFYSVNGIYYSTHLFNSNNTFVVLHYFFIQISVSSYVFGATVIGLFIYLMFLLYMNYLINNNEVRKERKMKKEKARVERKELKLAMKKNK